MAPWCSLFPCRRHPERMEARRAHETGVSVPSAPSHPFRTHSVGPRHKGRAKG